MAFARCADGLPQEIDLINKQRGFWVRKADGKEICAGKRRVCVQISHASNLAATWLILREAHAGLPG